MLYPERTLWDKLRKTYNIGISINQRVPKYERYYFSVLNS